MTQKTQQSRVMEQNEQEPLLPSKTIQEDIIYYETVENADKASKQSTDNASASASIDRQIFEMALPALGALLIDPIMNLTDTALVGRYSNSADELAGMGSSCAVLSFSFYIFNFLCVAVTPLVSSQRAANNLDKAVQMGGQALSFSLALGILLSIILIVFHLQLLQLIGTLVAGTLTTKYAIDFLLVRSVAAPAVLCISASTGILRGFLDTKTPLFVLIFANVINLCLDFILIPNYGPRGAGIATTTAEWISALIYLYILRNGSVLSSASTSLGSTSSALSIKPTIELPAWSEIKPLVIASSSLLIRSVSLQIFFCFAVSMATRAGSASVAAHQIAFQLWMICCQIFDSLEAAAQALVADAIHSTSKQRLVSLKIFGYAFILGIFFCIALGIGETSGYLIYFFTKDVATQLELSHVLMIVVLQQPLNALVFAADGVLQGASEFSFQAKAMAFSSFVSIFIYLCGNYWNLAFSSSDALINVWIAISILQIVRGLTSLYKLVDSEGAINLLMR